MDMYNKLVVALSDYAPMVITFFLFIWIVCFIWYLYSKKRGKEYNEFVNNDVKKMLNEEESKHELKKNIPMMDFERIVYESIGIQKNETLITLVRITVVIAIIALGFAVKLLAIFIAFEVVLILKTKVEDKKMEDDIGISRTEMINKFLDFYIPSVQSGTSVRQTMQNFIAQYGDEELIEYYYSTDKNKKVPFNWAEIIQVYENGIESEELGMQDKAELKQEEVDRMLVYFNGFKAKIGEVNPICSCYYIGVPAIAFLSYSNYTDTWNGWMGAVVVILLIIFFAMFNRLIQKKKKDCCEQIF